MIALSDCLFWQKKKKKRCILSCHLSTTRSRGFGFQSPLIKLDDRCDIFVDADNCYNIFFKLTIVETTIIAIFFVDVELFTLKNLWCWWQSTMIWPTFGRRWRVPTSAARPMSTLAKLSKFANLQNKMCQFTNYDSSKSAN